MMGFDSDWLKRAGSFDEYLEKADMNVPTMRQNLAEVIVSDEDHTYFSWLCSQKVPGSIKILAISESWCGDCVENLPVVAKLASLYPCFHLMVFSRDDNLDIMDKYLTDGKRTIPVFVFFDEAGEEIGRFIERPEAATAFLNQEMSKFNYLPEQERKKASYGVRTKLRKLYKSRFRNETIRAIRRILENRYGPKDP
jgi:thiol-disulfide isomerase/thioredoxin